MTANDDIIKDVIQREGGFVNDPDDAGGATKYGITIKTLSDWMCEPATVDDVKNLTEQVAEAIYQELYIDKPKINLIQNDGLRACIFDTGVNLGTGTAIKLLQQAVGTKPDGILGAVTLGVLKAFNPKELIDRYLNARQAYYNNIVARNPSQEKFAAGWKNRIDELRARYIW